MLRIYVEGEYTGGVLIYHCIAHHSDKVRRRLCSTFAGTQLETELNALGVALKYIEDNGNHESAIVYSTFSNAIAYARGVWKKPQLQRARDFVKYVSKLAKTYAIEYSDYAPADLTESMKYIKKLYENKPTVISKGIKGKYPWTLLPSYRTTLFNRNGEMLCDLTHEDYCEDFEAAIRFCRYYEKESINPKSSYAGCYLTTEGIPDIELPD